MYYVNIPELRAEMARQGYNQSSFAAATGFCRETIGRVLNGENPTYPFMCRCMEVLNLSSERGAQIFFAQ